MQSVFGIANALSEARSKKESTVLAVIDYKSCHERIWRAGQRYELLEDCDYIKNFLQNVVLVYQSQ